MSARPTPLFIDKNNRVFVGIGNSKKPRFIRANATKRICNFGLIPVPKAAGSLTPAMHFIPLFDQSDSTTTDVSDRQRRIKNLQVWIANPFQQQTAAAQLSGLSNQYFCAAIIFREGSINETTTAFQSKNLNLTQSSIGPPPVEQAQSFITPEQDIYLWDMFNIGINNNEAHYFCTASEARLMRGDRLYLGIIILNNDLTGNNRNDAIYGGTTTPDVHYAVEYEVIM